MVKQEEIIAEEAGGRGFMDMVGLGGDEPDYLLCLSPSSELNFASVCAGAGAGAFAGATPAAASPTCASYLAPSYHRALSFSGQERHRGDGGMLGFQCYGGGDQAIPAVVPQKCSPTADCSSSITSLSSSPTAAAVPAASSPKPQAFKKKGSRAGAQRKTASPAATNKRPRVRREKLGERIIALQQLVSPFGKSDTASVLHEALGYIRFLHDQVQALSSPYIPLLPPSAAPPVQERVPAGDLRSRGLCLVPVSCTEHVAGNGGGGAEMWSVAAVVAGEKRKTKRGGDLPGQLH